ncbi:MAG: glycoside hydrolase domain-containing protein [Candidatus Sulfotelmatobacter sp.]
MKLLSENGGWAATDHNLFWTSDGGTTWVDVTPKLNHKLQSVSSVFFLDTTTGWVLLKCGDDRDRLKDEGCWELASTSDAGRDWAVSHETIPVPFSREYLQDSTGFSGQSWLQFSDPKHGWETLRIATGSGAPAAGQMLRTEDGGATWVRTKGLPAPGKFRFVTPTEGWLVGDDEGNLFVTQDAGDKWVPVNLPKPKDLGPDRGSAYDLPLFTDASHGFLTVRYEIGPEQGPITSTLVLFSTSDGGKTWKENTRIKGLPDNYGPGTTYPAAVTPSGLVTAEISGTNMTLSSVSDGNPAARQQSHMPKSASNATRLSFIDLERGWVLADYWLFSTADGGHNWINVTPDPKETVPSLASTLSSLRLVRRVRLTAPSASDSAPATGSGISTHLGFERTNVPTIAQMRTWLTEGPFYDVGIYLPGSPNRHTDKNLTSTWVSSIEGQGWGLIPTWFGLQPNCACYYVNGQCTEFPSVYSSNPSTDGAQAADAAIAATQSLGLSTAIIYADVENYYGTPICTSSQQTAAGQAVQAYVDGFDSELHLNGYLGGIYANPTPITKDISITSTIPDDIWIAKTPASGKPPQVTNWNQGIKDTLWPTSQRIHQFLIDQTNVTWGGVAITPIDEDIDNATVANTNAVTKLYSYGTPTTIDCPSAIDTIPVGINDINNSGAFINGPNQSGTVVGTYQLTTGSPYYGFQNIGGVCSQISVSTGVYVEATGVNNQGQIVGYFEDSTAAWHGFQLNPGGTPIQIDFPSAQQTYLRGINDAGQIIGWAWNPSTFGYQTFMYYGGQFYYLGVSGGGTFDYMQGFGINGQAVTTGIWYYEPSTSDFELTATPSSAGWGGNYYPLTPGGSANTDAEGGLTPTGNWLAFMTLRRVETQSTNAASCGPEGQLCSYSHTAATLARYTELTISRRQWDRTRIPLRSIRTG